MGLKRKQMLMRQKGYFENKLQDRLSFLSGKGSRSPKADKDTHVRKLQANIRAVNKRLRLIADNEKKTEEMAKIKAERAATPRKNKKAVNKPKNRIVSPEIADALYMASDHLPLIIELVPQDESK
jgi:hypothetical protein